LNKEVYASRRVFIWISDLLGLKVSIYCAFVFIISSLFGDATGSSVGTIVTMVPILYPAGLVLEAHQIFLLGAIIYIKNFKMY